MTKIQSYKELKVWQKAIDLVDEVYTITGKFPKSEIYGLSSQMQRAGVSVPSSIAEGYNRNHRLEFIQFLGIANASAAELETQLIIARKQYGYIDYATAESLLIEVQKMLYVIIKKLKDKRK